MMRILVRDEDDDVDDDDDDEEDPLSSLINKRYRYELENSHANHQVNHRRTSNTTQHRYLNDIYLTRLFVLLALYCCFGVG